MFAYIVEKAMTLAFAAVTVFAGFGKRGKNGKARVLDTRVDGAPGFLDGGKRDLKFDGELFVGKTAEGRIKEALLGAGQAQGGDGLQEKAAGPATEA